MRELDAAEDNEVIRYKVSNSTKTVFNKSNGARTLDFVASRTRTERSIELITVGLIVGFAKELFFLN